MSSLYPARLKPDARQTLIAKLHAVRHGNRNRAKQVSHLEVAPPGSFTMSAANAQRS